MVHPTGFPVVEADVGPGMTLSNILRHCQQFLI